MTASRGWQETRTFHIYTCGTPSVISHKLLDLVVPKYLGRRCLSGQQQEEVPEFLEADRMRVRRRRKKCHEFGQRVRFQ